MTEYHTSINGLIQSVAAEALRPGTPDEIVLDMSELLAWHGTHCSKCGRLLSQQSIDYGRCLNSECLTMLVASSEANILQLHMESVKHLGHGYWKSPLLSPEESYPGLRWGPSGLARLEEIRKALHIQDDSGDVGMDVRIRMSSIGDELHQKLTYLSNYGGADWEVEITKDSAAMSFNLAWFRKTDDGWKYQMNGGLQCDAVAQPFGSVVLGEPSYWSIHT